MSRLRIVHETIFHFSKEVRIGQHRLVLRPREGHDLRVEEMLLQITPDFDVEWSRDVFGNSIATAHFFSPASTLRIKSTLLLTQMSAFPCRSARPVAPPRYPLKFSPMEESITSAFRLSTFPAHAGRVAEWLRGEIDQANFCEAETLAAAVNQKVRRTIRRRDENGMQTPEETLGSRSGSCSDMAMLLVECWRVLGFPARFVSGYLDSASEGGRASTHAWAETYLPEVGWTGFDPTLGTLTNGQHVAVGVSNDPRSVLPVTGSFHGDGAHLESREVTVKIRRIPAMEASAASILEPCY